MLSDGDAKTHDHLNKIDVYPGIKIEKEECLNHVAKRLGSALQNTVKYWSSRGVTLDGRQVGGLKDTVIDKLTSYYRKAINDHTPNVEEMKKAIYATLSHYSLTDQKPQHMRCPEGSTS